MSVGEYGGAHVGADGSVLVDNDDGSTRAGKNDSASACDGVPVSGCDDVPTGAHASVLVGECNGVPVGM